ncbi:hypothetical protein [Rhodonellum sp.]|uniref:hypothetical protein n=1 Tax=Rhodonellum sp. TaxID=2231180 RepID=UPI00271812CC|nr:hypothetical protein [Rhodonellum sp.]MDO9553461.1 hypothetical protein [Rhodonellum sp.]
MGQSAIGTTKIPVILKKRPSAQIKKTVIPIIIAEAKPKVTKEKITTNNNYLLWRKPFGIQSICLAKDKQPRHSNFPGRNPWLFKVEALQASWILDHNEEVV